MTNADALEKHPRALPAEPNEGVHTVAHAGPPSRGLLTSDWTLETIVARVGLITSGAYLLFTTEVPRFNAALVTSDTVAAWNLAVYAFAFILFVLAAIGRISLRTASVLALAAVIFGMSYVLYSVLITSEGEYLFDILPFIHRSAEMVTDGQNPYAVRGDPDFLRETAFKFGTSTFFITRDASGALIGQLLVYPAGHVLVFVPAVLLGIHDMRLVTTGSMLLVVVMLWWKAPPTLRPFSALPLLADPEQSAVFPAFGVADYLWLLPLMGAVTMLYSRRYGWAGFLYGLTASVKQQPWLLAPFLLLWIWNENAAQPPSARAKIGAQFCLISTAAFIAVNSPFMVWNFGDWFHGVSFPFTADLSHTGNGLAEIRYLGVDLSKSVYTVFAMGVLGSLLAIYARYYTRLRHAIWIFPPIVLWFAYRPLHYYYGPWALLLLFGLFLAWRENEDRTEGGPNKNMSLSAAL